MDCVPVFEIEEKEEKSRRCRVNKKLLPMKCHYFLDSAAASCVEPFASIYAKQLGISASSVGIVQSITPFLALIFKPLLGGLVDHFQTLKIALMGSILIKSLAYLIIPFTPEKSIDVLKADTILTCSDNLTFLLPDILPPSWQCLSNHSFSCTADCYNCSSSFRSATATEMVNITDSVSLCRSKELLTLSYFESPNPALVTTSEYISCFENLTALCTLTCPCMAECCSSVSDIVSVQFWMFALMRIIFAAIGTMTITLGDAACYELLEDKIGDYGRQRLFASLGWGIFSVITGVLMDAYPIEGKTNFAIGVYILAILVAINFIAVYKISVRAVIPSKNILKDVGELFTSFEAVVFMIACTVCGALESLNENYLFWYLEDMSATKTLVALTLTVNTLLSEVPIFVYTGVIVEKVGNYLSIVIVLLVFCFRHLCYSFIYNPWLSIPIALCHGITFSLFYASMTSYAKISAKVGTEATMQGLLNGLYVGLGRAIGSLAGGYAYDKLGDRTTFRISGTIGGVSGVAMLVVYKIIKRKNLAANRTKSEIELNEIE